MNIENKDIQELINESFKNGSMLESINHLSRHGAEVSLDINQELLPFTYDTVHLLSPMMHHERSLLFMYIEEMIQFFPDIKLEGVTDKKLLNVVETLLLALDYLTHERFIKKPFEEQNREELYEILYQCFDENKKHSFSTDSKRPFLNKSKFTVREGKVLALDEREERTRIYMAVYYQKPDSLMEHFKHLGKWLGEVHLKPNGARVSYEEYCAGMTDHELHAELLFYLSTVKKTLAWFLNSCSWRHNDLKLFDELDLSSKLGIRYD